MTRVTGFRILLNTLAGLFAVISDHSGFCLMTVWQPPSPNISVLLDLSGRQSLVVSWLVNHGNVSEVQVSRAENRRIIYSENVSVSSADGGTWSWASDLPLECVDHSVRIRHFYKESVVSRWSNWTTNPGANTKDEIMIFPVERMLREGTGAEFCCVPPLGKNITSMNVDFKSHPLISVGARVKAVRVDKLTIKQSNNLYFGSCSPLTLTCNTADDSSEIWNYIQTPPPKPRNLSCVTSDTITVSCVWDLKQQACYHNAQTQTLHIENSGRAPVTCQHSSCTFPAIPRLEEYRIRVVVKNHVGEEAERHSFNISDRVSPMVQLDTVSPGVTNATVSWIVEGNLTRLSVLCQVNAAPQGTAEAVASSPPVNAQPSCNSPNSRCRFQLERLVPNTRYSTRVRCSVNGRLWGIWTPPCSFTTRPLVSVNLWRTIKQSPNSHNRRVSLVWTVDVPGSATKVEIQGYVVQWWQRGQQSSETRDSGQNQTEVSIGPEQCDFTVEAVLRGGRSVPAHITVPKAQGGEAAPVAKRLSSSTAGGFNLSWAEQLSTTCGYTVEWCLQGPMAPCTLHWVKVPQRNNTLRLPAGNFRAGYRYTFNIYACTEKGHRLLEIQTGYSQELTSVRAPSVEGPFQRTSSSVALEWSYDEADPEHQAFITGYLVIVQDTLPEHSANVFNVSVADPQRKSVTIEGLQENREYDFSVSALTNNGPGQAASVTIRTSTNYSARLAKTLTPFFLLLGCVVLLWPRRKMLKEIFTYPAGMNIKASELDTFLNKADEIVLTPKLEECISCDIEILNTSPRLEATTSPRDTEPSAGFQSFTSPLSLLSDYCPQSAMPLWGSTGGQQTCITNKSYCCSVAEDMFSSPQVMMSEIQPGFEPEGLQESCTVIYGYISKDTL